MDNTFKYSDDIIKENVILLLFKANESAIDILRTYEQYPRDGKIEIFIFNVFLSKLFLKQTNLELFNKILVDYDEMVINLLIEWKLNFKVPDVIDFINDRTPFFVDEFFNLIENHGTFLSRKLYNVFYENPLTDNPISSSETSKIFHFQLALLSMIESMKRIVEIVNDQIK